jgi:hypothetical protein
MNVTPANGARGMAPAFYARLPSHRIFPGSLIRRSVFSPALRFQLSGRLFREFAAARRVIPRRAFGRSGSRRANKMPECLMLTPCGRRVLTQ